MLGTKEYRVEGRDNMVYTKSPLQMIMNSLLESRGRVWLTGTQPENRDKYALILFRTRPNQGKGQYIDLVSGELSPILFDDEQVVRGLDWALADGANVRVIFNRGSNAEEASRLLKRNNPHLYSLWVKESDNFKLYWSPIHLKQHFLAISGMGVIFEKPETDKSGIPWWAFYISDENLAEQWKKRFDSYIETGKLVELPLPPT